MSMSSREVGRQGRMKGRMERAMGTVDDWHRENLHSLSRRICSSGAALSGRTRIKYSQVYVESSRQCTDEHSLAFYPPLHQK